MNQRFLTITARADWQTGLRAAGVAATAGTYQGEVLNFERPGHFFGQLTKMRWDIIRAAQGRDELSILELAHRLGRDVGRVHEDIYVLNDLGLLERTDSGGVRCVYASLRIDASQAGSRFSHTGSVLKSGFHDD